MDFRCTHFAAARCRSCELLPLGVSGSADSKQSLLLQLFPDVSLQPMQFSSTPAGSRIRSTGCQLAIVTSDFWIL